ncbi:lytic murein transglycosylase [Chthonobacter rhizosphaerae]|uniref:lytic murein transglycosylase n=1 Tax=Chthonobacter rhizosphaerae TaxID=2735553 RepID=UPI001FE4874E|nr:lytic murein transglycosylase [Chthonobacter rhizosphaerae]
MVRCSAAAAALTFGVLTAPALARCGNGSDFGPWLRDFKEEAVASGISPGTVETALAGVTFDKSVISKDRGQGVFSQTFLEFAGRMVASYRLQTGAAQIKKQRALFERIERDFGVPAPVIVAVWGLETDFGANTGDMNTLRSLATLAHDCRRPEMFREELLDALRIIERGDLSASEMRGAWAGELGQTQFLATNYLRYGIDYDGDGRSNLIRSVPDVLGSTANYLAQLGWRRGEPWLREVDVPTTMPWEQADLSIKHATADWEAAGVRAADGKPLPNLPASLYLPMGRNGPAFLSFHNFDVYLEWNESLVYATTAAYFATRLAGAGPVGKGNGPVDALSAAELKQVQQALAARGIDPGPIDGKLGRKTRTATRQVQLQLGLPADGWPDHALLAALR